MKHCTEPVGHSMSNEIEPTKSEMFWYSLQQGLLFSFVEVSILVIYLLFTFVGDGVPTWILWPTFGVTALWVLVTSTKDALEQAKELVLERWIFMTDFVVAAMLLMLIALVSLPYAWWFSTMLLIAMAQNIRYTCMAFKWLLLEKQESKDDPQ